MDDLITQLPTWLKFLVIYGPLGIWVGIGEYKSILHGRASRAELAAQADAHRVAVKEMADRFAVATEAASAALIAQAADHREQLGELTNRFVALAEDITKQSTAAIAAARESRRVGR